MTCNKQRKAAFRNFLKSDSLEAGNSIVTLTSFTVITYNEPRVSIMHLPASHRRSLSVTARIVEDSVDEIEKVIRGKERKKSSHRITESFDEETRQKIFVTAARLREANDEMFRSLHLEPNVFSETQIVQARIVHLWTVLKDSRSRGLKRFGELAPEEATEVDSHVDRLLGILKEIL